MTNDVDTAFSNQRNFHENEFKYHGQSTAINFVLSTNKSGLPTIFIEMAELQRSPKLVKWDQKIVLQLNPDSELVDIATSLICRRMIEHKYDYHGPKKNKSVTFRVDQESIFVQLSDGSRTDKKSLNIKLPQSAKFHIGTLMVKSLSMRYRVNQGTAMAMLRI